MNIPFIAKRYFFFIPSAVLVLTSVVCLFVFGLKPDTDFTGGSVIEFSFTEYRPEVQDVQALFADGRYGAITVQPIGSDGYVIKLRFITEDEHQEILGMVRSAFEVEAGEDVSANKVLEKRVETVGPAISETLKKRSIEAGIAVVIAIALYIAYIFRKVSRPVPSWQYGIVAIVALVHDLLITLGVFSLLGYYMGVEVGIPFVVALLTILGYSVNDTIVVFDRVREKLIRHGVSDFDFNVNRGLNETFWRSVNTSVTVLVVLGSLVLFGGASIKYFAVALFIGVLVGTYSSIFIAAPLLVELRQFAEKRARK